MVSKRKKRKPKVALPDPEYAICNGCGARDAIPEYEDMPKGWQTIKSEDGFVVGLACNVCLEKASANKAKG